MAIVLPAKYAFYKKDQLHEHQVLVLLGVWLWLFWSILDITDEIPALDNVILFEDNWFWHEEFEDIVGKTRGMIILAWNLID